MPLSVPNDVTDVKSQIDLLLEDFIYEPDESAPEEVQQAIHVAAALQRRAAGLQSPEERRQQAELDRMMHHPSDKTTLVQMTDQAFRSDAWNRSADQLIHLLDVQGIPRFFSLFDRTLLRGFQSFGGYLPSVSMPLVKEKMRQETTNVVLPAEEEHLDKHLTMRKSQGLRMNVNELGEALLGEEEAKRRLDHYLSLLKKPEIEVISVKISTIYSQILPLAREHTVDVLCDRLEELFRAASESKFTRHDGQEVTKLVYLDMEEYRDMHLTADAFMQTLDREGLQSVRAGIVLQAYVPDSFLLQQRLNEWARSRVEQGGSPVTLRIVKGANGDMEKVEASIRDWPQAPYEEKVDTDANYARMLQEGLKPENIVAVKLGLASHNLFTLGYGLVMTHRHDAFDSVQFEMLEGMANHQRRALFEACGNVLLYAPICKRENFINAIGYLVRRLDENSGPSNFLRYAFNIEVGSESWQLLKNQFLESFQRLPRLSNAPRRMQDRRLETGSVAPKPVESVLITPFEFDGEPDTDWSLTQHSDWAKQILAATRDRLSQGPIEVPLVVDGKEELDRDTKQSYDPSRPGEVVANYREANESDIQSAVSCAKEDPASWRELSFEHRREILYQVADLLANRRGTLLGTMLAEGGKLLTESDPEVSEAIDFCRFYSDTSCRFDQLEGIDCKGKGVVAVVSPWNFPLAIPCGGVASALASGNTVILKPASDTVLIAYELCQCFWDAGVPREALQFVPCRGSTAGQQLVTHDDVDVVILTGGTETAERMLAAKPTMELYAETGGKNATIVTAMADRDLAIKNVVQSAFGHGGQKCSATSLLLLEKEVYEDEQFRHALADAVRSLHVDSAWNLASKMGPLIHKPSGHLNRSLTELEPGESWLVEPRLSIDGNDCLVSPAIKWNVQPNSYTHKTEFFGPMLGVICVENLQQAIDIVNATGYGLTSGLESLDDREHQIWKSQIKAGNLYINRSTTGAIVLRQPFGGMGKSNVGPGLKAGGMNYVAQTMNFAATETESQPVDGINDPLITELLIKLRSELQLDTTQLVNFATTCQLAAMQEFLVDHDHFQLIGEDNHRRYLALYAIRIRVTPSDTPENILARVIAARTSGARAVISWYDDLSDSLVDFITWLDRSTDSWAARIDFIRESDQELSDLIKADQAGRIRYADRKQVPAAIREAANQSLAYLADEPITLHGRVEMIWYHQEQSISNVYHRYGNLGERAVEN